jgi:hypothetical protein
MNEYAEDTPQDEPTNRYKKPPNDPPSDAPIEVDSARIAGLESETRRPMDEIMAGMSSPTMVHQVPEKDEVETFLDGDSEPPIDGDHCPFCNAERRPSNDLFCYHCGNPLRIESIPFCGNCRSPIVPHAKYCLHCGQSVEPVVGLVLRMATNNIPYHIKPEKQVYTVGRAVPQQNNYVDIDLGPFGQRKISRQHARIILKETEWYVEDMNSKGGTRVFNTPLQPFTPTRIENGMVIYFADVKFTVEMN